MIKEKTKKEIVEKTITTMNILELKQLINGIPDHFEVEISVSKKISDDVLEKMIYPFQFDIEKFPTSCINYDIGWSENKFIICIETKEL